MITGVSFLIIAAFGLHYADGGVTKTNEYVPIKYPGPIQEVTQNRYGTPDDIPEECRNKNYCTIKPADYPQEKFNKMFKGTKPQLQPTLVLENVADRQGDPDDLDNCESSVSYEPLYRVRSKRGDWRTVVQAPDENYVQQVRLEICSDSENACFTALPITPDIKTFCKQKYSVWEFLVETENNGTERIKSELPICCSCHYKLIT